MAIQDRRFQGLLIGIVVAAVADEFIGHISLTGNLLIVLSIFLGACLSDLVDYLRARVSGYIK
jgi:hypothetical protein